MQYDLQYDLIIVGAGPAGLNFAKSLAPSGLKIALLERQDKVVLANPAPEATDIVLRFSATMSQNG